MPTPQKSNWANFLGSGLAHVQNGVDTVAELGFALLKKAGKKTEPPASQSGNTYLRTARKAAGTSLMFLGSLGDAYYRKYEELKKRR